MMKNGFLRGLQKLVPWLLLTVLLSACGNADEFISESTAEPVMTETVEETAAVEETEPAETAAPYDGVEINADCIQSVMLVSSKSKSNATEKSIISALEVELERIFGQAPNRCNDKSGPDENSIEIVIGNTTREGSEAFYERVSEMGDWAYGISVSDGQLLVAGSAPFSVYQALDYLLSNLITQREDGTPQILLENGFEWFGQGLPEISDPEELLSSGKEVAFYTVEKLITVPSSGNYMTLEGGCSDGQYYYVGMLASGATVEKGIIYKYDMDTWELVGTSKSLSSDHTNDITYDSKNHRLVVNGSSSILTIVDPDTLEFIEHIEANKWARAISYLPETNQYIFGLQYGYAILDENFCTVSRFEDVYPKLTTQGMYSDGTYIYDPRWESNSKYQIIPVYTLEGEFVGPLHLYGIDGEPENFTRDGNTYIMGCNISDSVYRLILMEKTWWQF